jgi:hypothetical protein
VAEAQDRLRAAARRVGEGQRPPVLAAARRSATTTSRSSARGSRSWSTAAARCGRRSAPIKQVHAARRGEGTADPGGRRRCRRPRSSTSWSTRTPSCRSGRDLQAAAATRRARRRSNGPPRSPLGGGTNIFDALEQAFADPEVDTIYLLTDGAAVGGPHRRPGADRRRGACGGTAPGRSSSTASGSASTATC